MLVEAVEGGRAMSYCSALPVVESESNILIEACLAGVRSEAGLDDDPVLPSLASILPSYPRLHLVAPAEIRSLPSAETIVGVSPSAIATVRTRSVTRSIARSIRWPVLLCAFVGGIFGGAAVMKSPVGDTPMLQHAAKIGRAQAARAWHGARATFAP